MRKLIYAGLMMFSLNLAWAQSCVLLGKQPSFIVQFKTNYSAANFSRQPITVPGFQFRQMRPLLSGQHLLVFEANTGYKTCFSRDEVKTLEQALLKSPGIRVAMPNLLSKPFASIHSWQWNLGASPGGVEVEAAWKHLHYQGDEQVVVAVMDTGVFDHASLNPNLLSAQDAAKWQRGPRVGEDAGVYFNDNGRHYGLGAQPSCSQCRAAIHGSHVAGIIAASGQMAYGEQVYGVAPHTSILPINVFTKIEDPDVCEGWYNTPCTLSYLSDQMNAEAWLAGKNFKGLPPAPKVMVLNMSLGGYGECSRIAQESFKRLLEKNMSIVVAAGNSNTDAQNIFPAACSEVITVAATGPSGERAWYSNWGKVVNIAAPGGNSRNGRWGSPYNQIYSTVAGAYKFMQGTSMAAPMVAGVLALMYAKDVNLNQEKVMDYFSQAESLSPFPKEDVLGPDLSSCQDGKQPDQSCGLGIINAKQLLLTMEAKEKA